MGDARQNTFFVWLYRAFWAVWLAFPVYAWVTASEILDQADQLTELAPGQAACMADLPLVANFSATGQVAFWAFFTLHFIIYAALLAMAHWVIHSCARGRMFVAPLIRMLWIIAVIITLFPVVDLVLSNLTQAALVATGDIRVFQPDYAFDVTVFGVGLLLLTIAVAMRQAMQLHRDAELTI